MKKFLIVLTVVAMSAFLLVGCTPTTPTEVAVTGVTLDKATLPLTVGDAAVTLVATVAPATATNQSVTWASDDATVATVALGVVTPVAEGTATITVTTVDGSLTDTCAVTVSAAAVVPTPPTDAPIITSITSGGVVYDLTATTNYINKANADDGILVSGVGLVNSIIKIYVNDIWAGTGTTGNMGTFTDVKITAGALGTTDESKVITAKAKQSGLAESDASVGYTFTQDTVAPKIATATATSSWATDSGEVITVTFDEAVNTKAAVTDPPAAPLFANSALNYANWEVVGTSAVPGIVSTTKFEKVSDTVVEITYKVDAVITAIEYRTITAYGDDAITDLAGNKTTADTEKSCIIIP